ncbi:MAG: hypothetical protein GF408_03720 [Candidatus Omnitrophica bacterium]|nr:hypothetical protein [Candidatus Omnitrophota bacterium]
MNLLGISCFYHDSAASLLKDGKIAAAVQEERFSREKNTSAFPINAVNYCVQAGGISFEDLDAVVFHEKPFLKFARVVSEHIRSYPFSFTNFMRTMPHWLSDRLSLPIILEKEIGYTGKIFFVKHHLSHAAAAFLASPFDEAAIMTVDGVGEWATATVGKGAGGKVEIFGELRYPDSLGLLYTAVTSYLGFEANGGEGKVMGLAGYGEPVYLDKFREIVKIAEDGSFKLDESYFGFNRASRMFSRKFLRTFGPARRREREIEKRHEDIAASLQIFLEEVLLKMAVFVRNKTGCRRLCAAGGVFLNCVANARILAEAGFEDIFVQPASGDSGGALGAALYADNVLYGEPRRYEMEHAYLGPEFSRSEIYRALVNNDIAYEELPEEEIIRRTAAALSEGKIAGWFRGRTELGPRALGNRSILADPTDPAMKDILNRKIKHREPFRPFAPSVLEEEAEDYFELKVRSPFMLLAPRVKKEKKNTIPAVTHVDGTARVQTVSRRTNPSYWRLIDRFRSVKGVPMLLNTSFNLRGEPIVNSPHDAVSCFRSSGLDLLVMGDFIAEKR